MKAWIVAAAVLSIATVALALPESTGPVSTAAACEESDTACSSGCWEAGDTLCERGCVWLVGCRNIRIEE